MSKLIEDFSTKVEMVNPNNGFHYTDCVNLQIMDWDESTLVAYTFNSDSVNTAKQLYKALEKYKNLRFVTGVTGATANEIIQKTVARHMKELYKDKVDIVVDTCRYGDALYMLKTTTNGIS